MIALTGGGTGGHLAIAASVKEALCDLGHRPLFVGSNAGQDRRWFEHDSGFAEAIFLDSHGVMNRRGWRKVGALLHTLKLAIRCRQILKSRKISALLSVGGYSAAPAALAALSLRIPIYIHEQNAVTGTLNRLLRPFAPACFCPFEVDSLCHDYPIKQHFFQSARTRTQIKTVIFLGGSQGAQAINDFALSIADELRQRGIHIIHQCGDRAYNQVVESYRQLGIEAECFAFDPSLHERIAKADLAVARAGAGTLFELAASGLPALFVPYPYAAGGHQHQNARFLADRDLGWWVDQRQLKPECLLEKLDQDLSSRSDGLRALIAPHGATCIARKLLLHTKDLSAECSQ